MKVTNVIGSPRSAGNTAAIAGMLLSELQRSGAQATTYELNKLKFRGCQGCWACQRTSDHCVVKDGLSAILEDIKSSDVVVIASPIYFGDVTSQTKALIDRFFSFHATDFRTSSTPSRLAPGKALVLILLQGNPDPTAFDDVVARYARVFGHLGFAEVHTIRAAGVGAECDLSAHVGFGETCTIRAARQGPESVVRTQEPLSKLIQETARRVISSRPPDSA
jgi:multimeric flavodoxin WrbA